MSHLELSDIDLAYGTHRVIRKFSLKLEKGQIGCLLGPSGCGKTTVLRCIAGFEPVASGQIRLNDEIVSSKETIEPILEKAKVEEEFLDSWSA